MTHQIRRSKCTVSDQLDIIVYLKQQIDACLLDYEKCAMINDAAGEYNTLIELCSPIYFLDDEYEYIVSVHKDWNDNINENNKNYKMEEKTKNAWDDFMKKLNDELKKDDDDDGIIFS